MPSSLVYRTDDNTRWGGGQGSNLAAVTIDLNFWTLFSAVEALEDHQETQAGIDFINQPNGANTFYIHLTDHRVLGPFTLPAAQWSPKGEWQPTTPYAPFDVVSNNGQLYLVTVAHTSGATFSVLSTDGLGHALYVLILSAPANSLPAGGTTHQRLVKLNGSDYQTAWATDFVRMFVFVEGQPNASETLMQYTVTDAMSLPAGLVGSVVFANVGTQTTVAYSLAKNGAAIGSIIFSGPSPEEIDVSFTATVSFVPGDVITLVAPGTPDAVQSDISFTLLARLT